MPERETALWLYNSDRYSPHTVFYHSTVDLSKIFDRLEANMDKNAFLRELALILRQRGLTDEEIRIRIEKISSFIDGLSQEERNAVIGGNPNVAAIADRLFPKDTAPRPSDKPVTHGQSSAVQSNPPAPTTSPSQKPAVQKKPAESGADTFKITSDYKKNSAQNVSREPSATARNVAEIRRRDEEKLKQLKTEAQKPRKKASTGTVSLSQKYESERNFWVIFFCCIPILFFIAAVALSIFAVLFFGLIAVIIILVAILAIAVAAGSAVSLVGLIYGITQMISNPAIGLYEAGMGILVAGITMLVGVLIYNAAIRFIPWIMKKLKLLFKFALKKLGVLAEYLKGVCASI